MKLPNNSKRYEILIQSTNDVTELLQFNTVIKATRE